MSLYEMIKDMPMFERFSEEERKTFAKMDHILIEYQKGHKIIKEGDHFTSIFLLVKGSVLITKTQYDTQIRLSKLRPGEIFGEMSFFSKKPRQSNIIASEDVLAIKMDQDFFEKVNPEIKDKTKNYFIELLIKRLDAMNDSLMVISKLMHS
jgi:serine/threonine-protein kinase